MATLTIDRRFTVDAPPDQVLAYLTTPSLLVYCLQGAELTSSSEDGRSHEGTVTVKLGALSVSYRGTATFEEIDAEGRRLRVRAKAREKTGAGSAELTVTMGVSERDTGGSEVALDASATVSGRLVTLGRGMIEIVSEQVLSEFVTCLCSMVSASVASSSVAPREDATPAGGLGILWRALRSWLGRVLGRT